MNTYLLFGYYVTDDVRNGQNFLENVLAKSVEEAITIFKSFYPYRDCAIIYHVELRDSDIIVGKDGEE